MDDATYLSEDARDRRSALAFAQVLLYADPETGKREWERHADEAYRWLQRRDSLRAVSVQIVPGQPRQEGTVPMATTVYNLADNAEVPFTLGFLDVKGAAVPAPDGFTAAWTLADPDSTGAVLTPSADNTSAVLAGGVPDTNLMVSVLITIPNADGTTRTIPGAQAVIVSASDAETVSIVAGTPTPETPTA